MLLLQEQKLKHIGKLNDNKRIQPSFSDSTPLANRGLNMSDANAKCQWSRAVEEYIGKGCPRCLFQDSTAHHPRAVLAFFPQLNKKRKRKTGSWKMDASGRRAEI